MAMILVGVISSGGAEVRRVLFVDRRMAWNPCLHTRSCLILPICGPDRGTTGRMALAPSKLAAEGFKGGDKGFYPR